MNLNKLLQLRQTLVGTPTDKKDLVPMVTREVLEDTKSEVSQENIESLVNTIIDIPAPNLEIIDRINTVVKKIEGIPTEKKWYQSSIIMNAMLVILVSIAPQIDKLISKQPLATLDYVYLLGIAYGGGSVITRRITDKNLVNIK